jgi:ABC-type uncharacterized transport system YnjBCD substrate-binding protein
MRRTPVCLAAVFLWASAAAHALSVDAKALARYDHSYVTCEAQNPEMRGHRDAAYLALWRSKLDKTSAAQLASVRKSAAYKAEQRSLKAAAAKPAGAASSPIGLQCKGLWAEYQRGGKAPAPKPAAPHNHKH